MSAKQIGGYFPPEQQAIRARCVHPAGGWEDFSERELEQSIGERFEKMVARFPQRVAIQSERSALRYSELNSAANQIAHLLLARLGEANQPIALLLANDVRAYAAVMGILKAGKIYVILDPTFPRELLSYMLHDAQAAAIVCDGVHLTFAQELAGHSQAIIDLDAMAPDTPAGFSGKAIAPDQIAAISYTSGSTGQPKGVCTTHRTFLQWVQRTANAFHVSANDRRVNAKAFGSSVGIADTLFQLLIGPTSLLFDMKQRSAFELVKWMVAEKATMAILVTTQFREIVEVLARSPEISLPDLRFLAIGGETITASDVDAYRRYFADATILALGYGVTELMGAAFCFVDRRAKVDGPPLPSGYPLTGVEVMILDENGTPLGPEQPGEVAFRSPYLAQGYWGRPELTRAKFLPDPDGGALRLYLTGDMGKLREDGCLVHLGRKDSQVKIRGFRVDTAEVESALYGLAAVKSAAVVTHPDPTGNLRLIGYIVPSPGHPFSPSGLRKSMMEQLPDYMTPSIFVELDALPMLPTGKVNRLALPPPNSNRPPLPMPYAPPATPFEEMITAIWHDILGLDKIGIHDPFLDLGGSSLQAMRIAARVQDKFGVDFPLPEMLAASTVAKMALLITERLVDRLANPDNENFVP
jgi:amino acid adenylation domain-containing protein